jgi:PAS domain S-box-containing protein
MAVLEHTQRAFALPSNASIRHLEDERIKRARLRNFIGWVLPIGASFALALGVGAVIAGSVALALAGVVAAAFVVAAAWAKGLCDQGELRDASRLLALSLVLLAVADALFTPFLLPALVLLPLTALMLLISELSTVALRRMLWATFGSETLILLIAGWTPHALLLPPHWTQDALVLLAGAGTAFLTLMLLWQDSVRLTASVAAAEASERGYRQLAERFRQFTLATTHIAWTTSPEGVVVEDSTSWRAFTGQSVEEWKGSGWLNAVHVDDRERVRSAWLLAIGQRAPYELEYRLRRNDGSYAHTSARGVPVMDENGQAFEWVHTNTDITLRKEAEARVLEESRRKDEFLAMLGHELRNPLAPIMTGIQVLQARHPDPELLRMRRQAKHLVRLVDDLLDVSRITQGKIELRREDLDLADAVDRAAEISQPLLTERKHTLTLAVPRQALFVEGDAVRLAQVIANLLSNAAKYTEPGGQIRVEGRKSANGSLVLEISDNGDGIIPEMLEHVFDLFVQGTRTLERAQGGLGIGLTMVRRLVELHGGQVVARSQGVGKGSTFCITLPGMRKAPVLKRERVSGLKNVVAARRVLVVDDNVDAAEAMLEYLRLLGHDVEIVHDGPSALLAADRYAPDVVLLDLGLPLMDGYEVARRLRERFPRKMKLIAVTGYGQASDRQRSEQAGFDRHLVKPVELDVLSKLVAKN